MCNAWNHPPGCTCGWGGEGHLGGGHWNPYYHHSIHHRTDVFETYVNPNARCPVCGAPVFFYQSPYGGRVFFDELGPPWPKHPCTDSANREISFSSYTVKKQKWLDNGWLPAMIMQGTHISKQIITFRLIKRHAYNIIEAYTRPSQYDYLTTKSILHFVKLRADYMDVASFGVDFRTNIYTLKRRIKRK